MRWCILGGVRMSEEEKILIIKVIMIGTGQNMRQNNQLSELLKL
ncbi:hypothetical protein CLV58_115162 [Spirosoma oryzae]|uniref:Uncharacterized protein n=1 Tax=Spirosoma oryzae TaxID=1469603 RepID=A0A2T0SNT8_9BACT|nr:hypothetical protein CLV58_115162 [Spirosoma oryzae]